MPSKRSLETLSTAGDDTISSDGEFAVLDDGLNTGDIHLFFMGLMLRQLVIDQSITWLTSDCKASVASLSVCLVPPA